MTDFLSFYVRHSFDIIIGESYDSKYEDRTAMVFHYLPQASLEVVVISAKLSKVKVLRLVYTSRLSHNETGGG